MSETDELRQRLMALESHSAHQDGTIEDLSEMVSQQWTEIEALRCTLAELRARLGRVEDDVAPAAPDDQPPPHY
ncbi:MAG: SlyX family protein [Alphaproteobacteria bacterium]|jgi:SlyX protein|nr:SlyX family protein [Alphaproteobacteria bacterium]MDP6256549.1 SlyX family protein [Alphaproteobacteria bacterium]MDP7055530.1 SlyX family protein [Alphaproteobacteria bacterium]MDP7229394.1 SlyX family protein [Alphaproteobacteria bacterium]MDP7462593.1 SlyX family protein [Alphaproteobacteria bacterium]|tara:strand:+ start:12717 stop:12938 length:222 start_codon:yes stop_codon:yes gene_type:complete